MVAGLVYALDIYGQLDELRPFNKFGWHREHFLVAGLFFFAGLFVFLSRARIAAALFLSLLAFAEYHRHFSWLGACFAAAGAIDALLLSSTRMMKGVCGLLLFFHVSLLGLRFLSLPPTTALPSPPARERGPPESDAFERFRRESYISSGVAPKRYFGLFDEAGDTAAYETILRRAIIDGARLANEFAAEEEFAARVTEKELALTFIAEGGALLLTSMTASVEKVHPVYGIGLDNYREGLREYPDLAAALDETLGSRLRKLTIGIGGTQLLLRPMTFREAIAGTVLMYLHQKVRTDRLLAAEGRPALATMPLDRQFIVASLVYNSGILFAPERIEAIHSFSTGDYLHSVNELNAGKRPRLAVFPPAEAKARLDRGEPFPRQLTSWSAVYHILQRYGAWVGLERYASVFDERGAFLERR